MSKPVLSRRETLGGLAATAAALAVPATTAAAPSAGASAVFDRLAWDLLALDPESATDKGLDTGAQAALRRRLTDRTQAGIAARRAMLKRGLAALDRLPAARLSATEQTTAAVVRTAYRTALEGLALPYGDVAIGGWRNTPYVVIQNVGAYLDVPRFLDGTHPIRDADDAEAYLSRLAQFPAEIDGETARLRADGAHGAIGPSFLLDKTIAQLARSIADARRGGGLVESLARRTGTIPGGWDARATTLASGPVAAALERQLTEIRRHRARATDRAGIWARPHGDAFYAWALHASTTVRDTPEQVHKLGLDNLAELQGRMDPILRKLGFSAGTVGERMTALGKDPRFAFPDSDAGRAQIVKAMEDKIAFVRTRLPQAFRTLVPGNLEIRRIPAAEEGGAPGAYGGAGSIDGKIPGKIWLNLGDVGRHSRYSVGTLAFHEGIPGHVWQGEYANKLPLIRSLLAFNAYSEGWALYAEQLGDELGAYDADPVGRLGYLQSLAFRACRLVVDTGLHAKRWTREQAIQWFASNNGSGLAEVAPEVDRYCSWPGQACGYKMGHNEINRQRERARMALGSKYDLRDFDQAVVDGGNVPLGVLAANVGRYITSASG